MRIIKPGIIILTILAFVSVFAGCTEEKEKGKTNNAHNVEYYYICPMHPQVREPEPGKCPICSMELVKVEKAQAPAKKHEKEVWVCSDYPDITSDKPGQCPVDGTPMVMEGGHEPEVASLTLNAKQIDHFKAEIFRVQQMKMRKKVRLLGRIIQAEEKKSHIPARIAGRVEEVFIKSEGQFIGKGRPVLLLYSPQLISAGEEYIVAIKNLKEAVKNGKNVETFRSLAERSREKLKLWGMTDNQLKEWLENKRVPEKVRIYSPVTGIVHKMYARAGGYFKEGQNFFSVVDLSTLWVELDVYEHDSGLVRIGQTVSFTSPAYPGSGWQAPIDFINPILNPKTRTLGVRATIVNADGKLRPGMIVDADLNISLEGKSLVIPRDAVIDTGKRKVVWLEIGEQSYIAKEVRTGFESEGFVEVLSGLTKGQRVVAKGNFLLDAQAQLFGGYHEESSAGTGAHDH